MRLKVRYECKHEPVSDLQQLDIKLVTVGGGGALVSLGYIIAVECGIAINYPRAGGWDWLLLVNQD